MKTILIGISILAAFTTLMLNIRKIVAWFYNIFHKAYQNVIRYRPKVPKETLRFVCIPQQCWWCMGKSSGSPAMQVVSHWHVTNITDEDVTLCGTRVRKPRVNGFVMVRHPNSNIYGGYNIPPRFTTEASADFWIQPPTKKVGEALILDLEFLDQYGNVHRAKKITFRPPQPKKKDTSPPMEPIPTINDPTEKEVVSVLQNELHRYRECGRRAGGGGLGSVILNYRSRVIIGVGSDSRKANSPEQQSIVSDPQNAKISSDNGAVLINYYQTLSIMQKRRFVDVLLSRISKDNAYSPVGYFFLFVGYHIGVMNEVLQQAKNHLKEDGVYGFSNLLRLLDGFLRYEYPNFTTETLDDIDVFLQGIEEYTFRISERIRAIRTYLLSKRVGQSKEHASEKGEIKNSST
ncbi:hypothetical protein ACFL42_02830 [Candidatus Omnitrophota bacterium]